MSRPTATRKRFSTQPPVPAARSLSRKGFVDPIISLLLVVNPVATQSYLDKRDYHDHQEHHDCLGRGVTHFEGSKGGLVDIHHNTEGSVSWSSLGDDEHRFEDLERADKGHYRGEKECWRKHGDGDVPKPLQGSRPIDLGGFVQVAGDALQPSKQDDEGKPYGAPKIHENERWHRPVGRHQHVRQRKPELLQVVG